jgi:nitronate monooxygenase/enoyl-[acyl-carrier protein] reductase II
VIRTPFVDGWRGRPEAAGREAERLRGEVMTALRQGRVHELVPFTGQTAGLIHEVLPAAEIVRRIVAEAAAALERAGRLTS